MRSSEEEYRKGEDSKKGRYWKGSDGLDRHTCKVRPRPSGSNSVINHSTYSSNIRLVGSRAGKWFRGGTTSPIASWRESHVDGIDWLLSRSCVDWGVARVSSCLVALTGKDCALFRSGFSCRLAEKQSVLSQLFLGLCRFLFRSGEVRTIRYYAIRLLRSLPEKHGSWERYTYSAMSTSPLVGQTQSCDSFPFNIVSGFGTGWLGFSLRSIHHGRSLSMTRSSFNGFIVDVPYLSSDHATCIRISVPHWLTW
jgi:hypothetical protein